MAWHADNIFVQRRKRHPCLKAAQLCTGTHGLAKAKPAWISAPLALFGSFPCAVYILYNLMEQPFTVHFCFLNQVVYINYLNFLTWA